MKILTYYTDENKKMYKNFFLRSFNDVLRKSFKLDAKYLNEPSEDIMMDKIEYVIDNIDVGSKDLLIFSSCGSQFFRDFHEDIEEELENNNILFQGDIVGASSNFFVCRQNEETLEFFNTVLFMMKKHMTDKRYKRKLSDQDVINIIINNGNSTGIGILPKDKYYNVSASTGDKQWEADKDFEVPPSIMVHNSSWSNDTKDKIRLMRVVKNKVLGIL